MAGNILLPELPFIVISAAAQSKDASDQFLVVIRSYSLTATQVANLIEMDPSSNPNNGKVIEENSEKGDKIFTHKLLNPGDTGTDDSDDLSYEYVKGQKNDPGRI